MMKCIFNIFFITAVLISSLAVNAEAHRLQPAYLEINEQIGLDSTRGAGKFSILWKRPLTGSRPMNIHPQLPASCKNITEPVVQPLPSGAVERWIVDCGSKGMINETIVINGLPSTETDTLLRIQLNNGSMHTTVLRPDSPSFLVPPKASKSKVAGSYLVLGIEHILGGFDHLLFVLASGLSICHSHRLKP
jgi:hypothetical protein